jgi:hypothetical protein
MHEYDQLSEDDQEEDRFQQIVNLNQVYQNQEKGLDHKNSY